MSDSLGSRHESRERALSLLYEAETKGCSAVDLLGELPVPAEPFAVELVTGVDEHRAEADALIRRFSRGWALERMPVIDRTLLRMAIFELAHRPDVPSPVVIDEAVELAKQYSTDDSGRFVNGMLSTISTELRG
jgi:transcription antitermination protein NusB